MHRSGTSLVAGMLSLLGVYIDPAWQPPAEGEKTVVLSAQACRDGYGEAVVFRLLNEWVMGQTGATWDHTEPFLKRRDQPGFARISLTLMQMATFGSLDRGYLKRRPEPHCGPWGWKDPRNSLTLPYWLRLFPEARIVHVRRHPESVADSLLRRAESIASTNSAPTFPSRLRRMMRHPGRVLPSLGRQLGLQAKATALPALDRSRCLHLWQQYDRECLRYRCYEDQYLEVWFEDILNAPATTASCLAQFAQVSPSQSRQEQAIAFVQHEPVPYARIAELSD